MNALRMVSALPTDTVNVMRTGRVMLTVAFTSVSVTAIVQMVPVMDHMLTNVPHVVSILTVTAMDVAYVTIHGAELYATSTKDIVTETAQAVLDQCLMIVQHVLDMDHLTQLQ